MDCESTLILQTAVAEPNQPHKQQSEDSGNEKGRLKRKMHKITVQFIEKQR
jgi:hypothetical protein